MINFPGRMIDHISAWGGPWHGLNRNGALTLPNGDVLEVPPPSGHRSGDVSIVRRPGWNFERGEECAGLDAAAGAQWLDHAVLSGRSRTLYGQIQLGPRAWLYFKDDNRWLIRADSLPVDPGTSSPKIRFRIARFGEMGAPSETAVQDVPLPSDHGFGSGAGRINAVEVELCGASGDGGTAVIGLSYAAPGSLSVPFDRGRSYPEGFFRVSVEGGIELANLAISLSTHRSRTDTLPSSSVETTQVQPNLSLWGVMVYSTAFDPDNADWGGRSDSARLHTFGAMNPPSNGQAELQSTYPRPPFFGTPLPSETEGYYVTEPRFTFNTSPSTQAVGIPDFVPGREWKEISTQEATRLLWVNVTESGELINVEARQRSIVTLTSRRELARSFSVGAQRAFNRDTQVYDSISGSNSMMEEVELDVVCREWALDLLIGGLQVDSFDVRTEQGMHSVTTSTWDALELEAGYDPASTVTTSAPFIRYEVAGQSVSTLESAPSSVGIVEGLDCAAAPVRFNGSRYATPFIQNFSNQLWGIVEGGESTGLRPADADYHRVSDGSGVNVTVRSLFDRAGTWRHAGATVDAGHRYCSFQPRTMAGAYLQSEPVCWL